MANRFEQLKGQNGIYKPQLESFESLKEVLDTMKVGEEISKKMQNTIDKLNNGSIDEREFLISTSNLIKEVSEFLEKNQTTLLKGQNFSDGLKIYTNLLKSYRSKLLNDTAQIGAINNLLNQISQLSAYLGTFNGQRLIQWNNYINSIAPQQPSTAQKATDIVKDIFSGGYTTSGGKKSPNIEDIQNSLSFILDPKVSNSDKTKLINKQAEELSSFYRAFKVEFEQHIVNAKSAQGVLKKQMGDKITLDNLADVENAWWDLPAFINDVLWIDFYGDTSKKMKNLLKEKDPKKIAKIGVDTLDYGFTAYNNFLQLYTETIKDKNGKEVENPSWIPNTIGLRDLGKAKNIFLRRRFGQGSEVTADDWERFFKENNSFSTKDAEELAKKMDIFTGDIDNLRKGIKNELIDIQGVLDEKSMGREIPAGTSLTYKWGNEVFTFDSYEEKAKFLSLIAIMLEGVFNDLESWPATGIATLLYRTSAIGTQLMTDWNPGGIPGFVLGSAGLISFLGPLYYDAYRIVKFSKNLGVKAEKIITRRSVKIKESEKGVIAEGESHEPGVHDSLDTTRFNAAEEQNLKTNRPVIQKLIALARENNNEEAVKKLTKFSGSRRMVYDYKIFIYEIDKLLFTDYIFPDGSVTQGFSKHGNKMSPGYNPRTENIPLVGSLEKYIHDSGVGLWDYKSKGAKSVLLNLYKRLLANQWELNLLLLPDGERSFENSIYRNITGKNLGVGESFSLLMDKKGIGVNRIKDSTARDYFTSSYNSLISGDQTGEKKLREQIELFSTFESTLEENNTQNPSFSDAKEKLLAIARNKIKNTTEFEKLSKAKDGKSIIVLTREILSEAKNVGGFKDDIIKVLLEKLSTPGNPTFEIIPPIEELHGEVVGADGINGKGKLANLIKIIESLSEHTSGGKSLSDIFKEIIREGLINSGDDRISDLEFILSGENYENFKNLLGMDDSLRVKLLDTLIKEINDPGNTQEVIKKTLNIPGVYSKLKTKLNSITDTGIKEKILKEVEGKGLSAGNIEPYIKEDGRIDFYLKIQREILANIELDTENKEKIQTVLKEAFEKDIIDWIKIEGMYNEGIQLIKIAERRHAELREDARARAQTEQMLAANGKSLPSEKTVGSSDPVPPKNEGGSTIEVQTPAMRKIKNDIKLALAYQMAFDDTPELTRNDVNSFLESSEAQTMSLTQYEEKLKTLLKIQNLPANPKELELRAVKVDGVIIGKYTGLETSNAAIKRAVETLVEDYKEAKNNGREKLEEFLRKEEARIKFKDVAKKI